MSESKSTQVSIPSSETEQASSPDPKSTTGQEEVVVRGGSTGQGTDIGKGAFSTPLGSSQPED